MMPIGRGAPMMPPAGGGMMNYRLPLGQGQGHFQPQGPMIRGQGQMQPRGPGPITRGAGHMTRGRGQVQGQPVRTGNNRLPLNFLPENMMPLQPKRQRRF